MSVLKAPAFRIPEWSELLDEPGRLRRFLNLWPPFVFAGIRVISIEPDWSGAKVRLDLNLMSRNYVGTQFGGSMFAMTDPFWMILLIHRLGPEYVVWDQRAEIEFVRPGKTDVTTEFVVDPAVVAEIREAAHHGEKVLRWFSSDIVDERGEVVARVRRQLYVRRRQQE
jgi:acyl-coenzyme A thioesterase PaaI-like protein